MLTTRIARRSPIILPVIINKAAYSHSRCSGRVRTELEEAYALCTRERECDTYQPPNYIKLDS